MDKDNKVVAYIYHDTTMSDVAMKKIKDLGKRVNKLNRCLATLAVVSAVYFTVMNLHCELQREKMDKMSKDIEELKKTEGE